MHMSRLAMRSSLAHGILFRLGDTADLQALCEIDLDAGVLFERAGLDLFIIEDSLTVPDTYGGSAEVSKFGYSDLTTDFNGGYGAVATAAIHSPGEYTALKAGS